VLPVAIAHLMFKPLRSPWLGHALESMLPNNLPPRIARRARSIRHATQAVGVAGTNATVLGIGIGRSSIPQQHDTGPRQHLTRNHHTTHVMHIIGIPIVYCTIALSVLPRSVTSVVQSLDVPVENNVMMPVRCRGLRAAICSALKPPQDLPYRNTCPLHHGCWASH
jgi:hypothetical protein